jgi:putative membrane protein
MSEPRLQQDFSLYTGVALVSLLVVSFLFWLIYFQPVADAEVAWVSWLPQVNAALNFTSLCLVLCGLRAIKLGQKRAHGALMVSALVASALFLVSYVIYHTFATHTTFEGTGVLKVFYLLVLLSHIIMSVVLVPLLLTTVAFAIGRRFVQHRKLARWTYPIWLYVSATGVLVFVLLRGFGV